MINQLHGYKILLCKRHTGRAALVLLASPSFSHAWLISPVFQGEGAWEPKANCKNRQFLAAPLPRPPAGGKLGSQWREPEDGGHDEDDRQFASEDEMEDEEAEARWVAKQRSRGRGNGAGGGGRTAPSRHERADGGDADDAGWRPARGAAAAAGGRPARRETSRQQLQQQQQKARRPSQPFAPGSQGGGGERFPRIPKQQQRSDGDDAGEMEGADDEEGAAALLAALSAGMSALPQGPPGSPNGNHRRKGKPQRSRLDGEVVPGAALPGGKVRGSWPPLGLPLHWNLEAAVTC